jgi:YfiH family protein
MWTIESSPFGRIAVAPAVPPGFAVFCTTRDFPGFLDEAGAAALTAFIRQRFGVESSLTTCTQVHGAAAARAGRMTTPWRECDACDALWSDERGVALGIKVADCLPVAMLDPSHNVIANVHSGWRGAVQRIAASTVDVLERSTSFSAREALAYLGPSIRACCFEVGEEVAGQFDERFVDRSGARPHVDLAAMTVDALTRRGFDPSRLFDSGLCTRCEGSIFHSYRRDGKGSGRNLAFAAQ